MTPLGNLLQWLTTLAVKSLHCFSRDVGAPPLGGQVGDKTLDYTGLLVLWVAASQSVEASQQCDSGQVQGLADPLPAAGHNTSESVSLGDLPPLLPSQGPICP